MCMATPTACMESCWGSLAPLQLSQRLVGSLWTCAMPHQGNMCASLPLEQQVCRLANECWHEILSDTRRISPMLQLIHVICHACMPAMQFNIQASTVVHNYRHAALSDCVCIVHAHGAIHELAYA